MQAEIANEVPTPSVSAIRNAPVLKKYEYQVAAGDGSHAGRLLDMVGSGKRVLEVGCASGSQTRALVQQLNCVVVGIEIDAIAAERARPYCQNLLVGDIESMDLRALVGGDQFDVIIFADVLEHLRDPAAALRKCRPFLRDDGYFVVSLPNITHASIAYELARGRFEYRDKGLLDDTHIRFFSRASTISLFSAADLLAEKVDRSITDPRFTEFETEPNSNEDRALLRYIFDNNADSSTYQFLIKAVPMDSNSQLRAAALSMREQIEALEQKLHKKDRELNKLQSEINWLLSNPWRALMSGIRNLRSRGV